MKKRIAIVYFSFTGNTENVVNILSKVLNEKHDPSIFPVVPLKERNYWEWLLLSFFPGSSVEIRANLIPSLDHFDHLFFAFPKWTLSCPPVNRLIYEMNGLANKPSTLIVTYGGFDGKRYIQYYENLLGKRGIKLTGSLLIRRSDIKKGNIKSMLLPLIEQI